MSPQRTAPPQAAADSSAAHEHPACPPPGRNGPQLRARPTGHDTTLHDTPDMEPFCWGREAHQPTDAYPPHRTTSTHAGAAATPTLHTPQPHACNFTDQPLKAPAVSHVHLGMASAHTAPSRTARPTRSPRLPRLPHHMHEAVTNPLVCAVVAHVQRDQSVISPFPQLPYRTALSSHGTHRTMRHARSRRRQSCLNTAISAYITTIKSACCGGAPLPCSFR